MAIFQDDPFTIPFAITILYVYLHFYRAQVWAWIARLRDKTRSRITRRLGDLLHWTASSMGLRLGNWHLTLIAFPLLVIAADNLLSLAYRKPIHAYRWPLLYAAITSGLLAPISESLIQCGGIGTVMAMSTQLAANKKWNPKRTRHTVLAAGAGMAIYVALIFALNHPPPANDPTTFEFAGRFAAFLLFGAFYIASGRNMLAPIVAHGAGNWFLMLKDALYP